MGFETSFVEGFAGVRWLVCHRGLAHIEDTLVVNKNKMVGAWLLLVCFQQQR